MPLIIPSNTITGGYEVDNSLRFNDDSSDYLEKTFSTSSSNIDVWTFSVWFKRGFVGTDWHPFFEADVPSTTSSDVISIYNDQLYFGHRSGTASVTIPNLFRDPSAWYHLYIRWNGSLSGLSNVLKIYINGVEATSFSSLFGRLLLDTDTLNFGSNVQKTIGNRSSGSAAFFDGYMAEFCFIDGTAYDPTSFGEFDEDSGIWKPIDVSGLTFGTNGFYLDFENSGSLGADVSGNGNNFTVNNLTSDDQMIDTPTNNYCTFNALANSGLTLSQGNLRFDSDSSNRDTCISTFGVNQGKWYWEVFADTNDIIIGIEKDDYYPPADSRTGQDSTGIGFRLDNGDIYVNGSTYDSSYSSTIPNDAIIGVALNMDDGEITFYNENSSLGVAYSSISGTYLPSGSDSSNVAVGDAVFNFGQDSSFAGNKTRQNNQDDNEQGDFYYSPPSGYYALNTKNLAEYG